MGKSAKKWRRRTPQQWQALLERQAASGQSIEAFCRSQSLTTASFYRWRRQLGVKETAGPSSRAPERESAPPFVDLGTLGADESESAADSGGWDLELALGTSVVLRLRGWR
jgi:transposase-like protein